MRKLSPEERAEKNARLAQAHVHDENCGHLTVTEAPVAEETPAEAPVAEVVSEVVAEEAPVEDKPKKKKKAEEATVAEEA